MKGTILTLILLGGIGTFGKNYFIYHQLESSKAEHPDQFQYDSAEWKWDGVTLNNVQLTSNPETGEKVNMETLKITHSWAYPIYLTIKADKASSGKINILEVRGSFTYWNDDISSKDFSLFDTQINTNQGHLEFPMINIPFSYNLSNENLKLNASIPNSPNGTFKNLSFNLKGDVTTKPALNGKLDIDVKGISKLIQALVEAGVIEEKNASYLEFGTKILAGDTDDSQIPITFKNGDVYLGPILIYSQNANMNATTLE